MPWTFVRGTGGLTASGGSLTFQFSTAPSSGQVVVIYASAGVGGDTISVSDNDSNTWNGVDSQSGDGNNDTAEFFWAVITSLSPNANPTFTITWAGTTHSMRWAAVTLSPPGSGTISMADHGTAGSGTAGAAGTVTTAGTAAATNDMVVAGYRYNVSGTFTAGTGYTLASGAVDQAAANTRVTIEYKTATAGGSQSATITDSATTGTWMANILVLTQASATPNTKDTPGRFRLLAQAWKDTVGRFKLSVPSFPGIKDTPWRYRLQGLTWKDTVGRFNVGAQIVYRHTALRLRLLGVGYRHTAWRFLVKTAGTFRDSITRIRTRQPGITAPLTVLASNNHWFKDATGKAILLTGSQTWNSLRDLSQATTPPAMDFNAYVAFLKQHGHNCTILWERFLPTYFNWGAGGTWHIGAPWPWPRTGGSNASDGLPQFDLTTFNQAFFDRVRARVIQLQQNDIYAIVQLFDGLSENSYRGTGDGYPFTCNATGGNNNTSGGTVDDGYTTGSSGVGAVNMTSANAITAVYDAYIQKMCDTLHDCPNVIWEPFEESVSATQTWLSGHVIDLLHSYETSQGYLKHPVLDSCVGGGGAVSDGNIYTGNAEAVAPAGIAMSGSANAHIAPTNNSGKVIINDSDHTYFSIWTESVQVNRNWIWENICNGASALFMDPYLINWGTRNAPGGVSNGVGTTPDTKWDNFRDNLGWASQFVNGRCSLKDMTPQASLASTGFCLAFTPQQWLAYAPSGGSFTVNLSSGSGRTYDYFWLDPVSGGVTFGGSVPGGSATQSFTPPWGSARDAIILVTPAYRDWPMRFALLANGWRDTVARLRLQSANAFRETVLRFALVPAFTWKHTPQRFKLQALLLRDTPQRLRLRAQAFRDVAPERFKVRSAARWFDTPIRFSQLANAVRDTPQRFRLIGPLSQYHDTPLRLALRSAVIFRNTALRFVVNVPRWRDTHERLRISAAGTRNTPTRFVLFVLLPPAHPVVFQDPPIQIGTAIAGG